MRENATLRIFEIAHGVEPDFDAMRQRVDDLTHEEIEVAYRALFESEDNDFALERGELKDLIALMEESWRDDDPMYQIFEHVSLNKSDLLILIHDAECDRHCGMNDEIDLFKLLKLEAVGGFLPAN